MVKSLLQLHLFINCKPKSRRKIEDFNKETPNNTSILVKNKTNFNTNVVEIENKIPNITCVVIKTSFNSNITEIKNKILETNGLVMKPNFKIRFDF